MEHLCTQKTRQYLCQRCGDVTMGEAAIRRYCALCGVHEAELGHVKFPAQPGAPGLPAAL